MNLLDFEGRKVKVKVTVRSNIWVIYCCGWCHGGIRINTWASKCHLVSSCLFEVRATSTPAYLSRHIKLRDTVRTLRSAMTTRLSEPFASTAFAKRAFRCSAPATWNFLPRTVTDSNSIETFKSRLKTFLYSLSYNRY